MVDWRLCVVFVIALAGSAGADESIRLEGVVGVPHGFGSADIVYVDPYAGLLALADRSNKSVDVVDLNVPGEVLARQLIPVNAGCTFAPHCAFQGRVANDTGYQEFSGPNGVVTVNDHRELWATDAPETNNGTALLFPSSIKVLDIRSGTVLDVISNGGNHRADEVAVDPRDHVFIAANPADTPAPFVTLISTDPDEDGHHAIIKKIYFDGHDSGAPKVDPACGLEQPTWDPDSGLFFMAIPSFGTPDPQGNCAADGGVVAINPRGGAEDMRVVKTYPVANCSPQGTALGPDGELFLGCAAANSRLVILNIRSGRQTGIREVAGGCDEVWFNPGDDHFLGSCDPDGTSATQYLSIIDADPLKFDANVATQPTSAGGGSHTVAADAYTNRIFVPLPASTTNNAICAAAKPPANTFGCIAVFKASGRDDAPVEHRRHRHISEN